MKGRTIRVMLTLGLAALIAVIDQYVKLGLVMRALAPGESQPVLPGILSLTFRQNTGAAFSLLERAHPGVLLGLNLVVLALFMVMAWPYLRTRVGLTAAVLVLGGALGNLIDRLRLHYVIDYLDFHVWPVFNLADICVVVGIGLLVLLLLRSAQQPTAGEGDPA